jgi:5-methylcytosine-specific restriction enzyme subunit McrC
MDRKIPIYNIYNMLCYAWDVLEEKDVVKVETDNSEEMIELFTKVLVSGTRNQIRKGLDRDYVRLNDEIRGIKGKIDFSNSINKLSFQNAKSYCVYDEFSYDIINNQIIKSTLEKLLFISSLDEKTRNDVQESYDYLDPVSTINIEENTFNQVRIDRNNHNYKILMSICKLIHRNYHINENTGKYEFSDFFEDEKQMATLFENFVRNFYRRELPSSEYEIGVNYINWDLDEDPDEDSLKYLPRMKTDISVVSDKRNLIIDTKYYRNPIKMNQYQVEKMSSGNLYQLYSYINNSEKIEGQEIQGMLLYPTIDRELNLEYIMNGHKMSVNTINLAAEDWGEIKDRLLGFVEY